MVLANSKLLSTKRPASWCSIPSPRTSSSTTLLARVMLCHPASIRTRQKLALTAQEAVCLGQEQPKHVSWMPPFLLQYMVKLGPSKRLVTQLRSKQVPPFKTIISAMQLLPRVSFQVWWELESRKSTRQSNHTPPSGQVATRSMKGSKCRIWPTTTWQERASR